jgi:hypothetical protein
MTPMKAGAPLSRAFPAVQAALHKKPQEASLDMSLSFP